MEDKTRKETSEIVEMIKLGSVIVVLLLLFKLVTNNAARTLDHRVVRRGCVLVSRRRENRRMLFCRRCDHGRQ